ncbi:UbiA family prenyltransferase [Pleomorphomonas sp. PLEO]|uniref:UbiA family prenyltransferase n=1 Tax=Pleomorphomonas sp. PLEO TaxID=3239306 RepID=UPI00351EA011
MIRYLDCRAEQKKSRKMDFDVETGEEKIPSLNFGLSVPLVLDMDGALLATDTLHEAVVCFIRRRGLAVFKAPSWLMRGRGYFKTQILSSLTAEDIAYLPSVAEVVAFAEREASLGRRVVLTTAADRAIAERVAAHYPFVAEIIASDEGGGLKGADKASLLAKRFPEGFVYAGDSSVDPAIWKAAVGTIVVGPTAGPKAALPQNGQWLHTATGRGGLLAVLRRSLRLHQWVKNGLVFVPLILSGQLFDPWDWLRVLIGFIAIGLLASATYVLNDLWDLSEDRQHWSKRNRPLASGRLSIIGGVTLIASCGLGSLAAGLALGPAVVGVLSLYLVISLAYSFRFKREPIIDVFLLATMFSLRLALGIAITHAKPSPWLIVFSMFTFLSLSLAKRLTEIKRMAEHGLERTLGRGYEAADAPLVLALGVGSTLATVLIMVLYLIDDAFPAGVYHRPDFLWGFPIVIFLFLSRIWLVCHRGDLHDDPVAYALKDKVSLFYGATMTALFVAAMV